MPRSSGNKLEAGHDLANFSQKRIENSDIEKLSPKSIRMGRVL